MRSESTPRADTWWVEVFLGETDGKSTAHATLHTGARARLSSYGDARLNPRDEDVPQIGYELATARALSALAQRILEAAADDISGMTDEMVSVAGLAHDPAGQATREPHSG